MIATYLPESNERRVGVIAASPMVSHSPHSGGDLRIPARGRTRRRTRTARAYPIANLPASMPGRRYTRTGSTGIEHHDLRSTDAPGWRPSKELGKGSGGRGRRAGRLAAKDRKKSGAPGDPQSSAQGFEIRNAPAKNSPSAPSYRHDIELESPISGHLGAKEHKGGDLTGTEGARPWKDNAALCQRSRESRLRSPQIRAEIVKQHIGPQPFGRESTPGAIRTLKSSILLLARGAATLPHNLISAARAPRHTSQPREKAARDSQPRTSVIDESAAEKENASDRLSGKGALRGKKLRWRV